MTSIYKKNVSDAKKYLIYKKTHGICIICSKKIVCDCNQWSLDHYIPRAIYKWIPDQDLRNKLESLDNLFIVHRKCNINKDANLPTLKDIHNLPIDNDLKSNMVNFYQSVEDRLIQYQALKQGVLTTQKFRCLFCKRTISVFNSTLRRIDNKKLRVMDNAICLCFFCSVRAGNSKYKQKMVAKQLNASDNTKT